MPTPRLVSLAAMIALNAGPSAGLAAGTAAAQTPQPGVPLMTAPRPEDKATTPPTVSEQGMGGAAPSRELERATPGADRPLTVAEARTLVGRTLRTRDGEPAGTIHDFTLTGPDGPIDRVVVAPDGTDATLVAVPVSALRVGDGGDATLDLSADQLRQEPAFRDDGSARALGGKR